MKICPSPDCPHFLRLGQAAEYVDSLATCPDCGSKQMVAQSLPKEAMDAETQPLCHRVVHR